VPVCVSSNLILADGVGIVNLFYYYPLCCLVSGEGIVSRGVRLSRCVCVRRISLGGLGNALYSVLSSYCCYYIFTSAKEVMFLQWSVRVCLCAKYLEKL